MDEEKHFVYLIVITVIKLIYELDQNDLLSFHLDISGEQVEELLKAVNENE